MKHVWLTLVFLAACASHAEPLKEQKTIHVCGISVKAEVARSDDDRARGLMGRTALAKGRGMIFVFEGDEPRSFWMKNVPFDIDIGFFDAKGAYVSHTTMRGTSPLQRESALQSYPSAGPAKYAVEVPEGFFKNLRTAGCRLTPLL
jgi:hypothetical protein